MRWNSNILDLGNGWAPAVLGSEGEFAFLRTHLCGVGDLRHFFIGGSTNITIFETFQYLDYNTTRSGDSILPVFSWHFLGVQEGHHT